MTKTKSEVLAATNLLMAFSCIVADDEALLLEEVIGVLKEMRQLSKGVMSIADEAERDSIHSAFVIINI